MEFEIPGGDPSRLTNYSLGFKVVGRSGIEATNKHSAEWLGLLPGQAITQAIQDARAHVERLACAFEQTPPDTEWHWLPWTEPTA